LLKNNLKSTNWFNAFVFVMRYTLLLFLLLPALSFAQKDITSQNAETGQWQLTLPIYQIEIDSTYLEKLHTNPWADLYFPAKFSNAMQYFDCEVRFRGGTSRNLPKKSWRIKFEDTDNIFGAEHINLNAEYRDRSLMRNHLAMKLFRHFGFPAPQTEYVNLFVNGTYLGVHLQVEDIDTEFLLKNNRKPGRLYKAIAHGANMAPLLFYDDYSKSWETKIGNAGDFTALELLHNKLLYSSNTNVWQIIDNEFNLANIINFFAIEFAIYNFDGITKNFFLYFNPDDNKYEFFPWGNDATFGNSWRGDYDSTYTMAINYETLDHQLLLQRFIENPAWESQLIQYLHQIANNGFSFLNDEIDTIYDLIKNDVYQDSAKVCSNEEFDQEIVRIKHFLSKREQALLSLDSFNRNSLHDEYISNAFPTLDNPDVTFRITAEKPLEISVLFAKGLRYGVAGDYFTLNELPLYDDGLHDDLAAGDLIYGNSLNLNTTFSSITPFTFSSGKYSHPANGLFYINFIPTKTYAIINSTSPFETYQKLAIGKIYTMGQRNYALEVINQSEKQLNLSLCHLQGHEVFYDVVIPPNTFLGAGDTLLVTNNTDLTQSYFAGLRSIPNIYFDIHIGDSLKILSPTRRTIASTVVSSFSGLAIEQHRLVINEINYHSSEGFNTEDWIEIYNPNDFDVDMTGWYFKDEKDEHLYKFPTDTKIKSHDFLVLCRNLQLFQAHFQGLTNITGNFDFGLSGDCELIRLFDVSGNLVDSLRYDDQSPWPTEADGEGFTLELLDPNMDNAKAENWGASQNIGGSPGSRNTVVDVPYANQKIPEHFELAQNFPNPFNNNTIIKFNLPKPGLVELKIFNLNGQLIDILVRRHLSARSYEFNWQANNLGSGIYFYQLIYNDKLISVKKALCIR
jgi:hypothetical protein